MLNMFDIDCFVKLHFLPVSFESKLRVQSSALLGDGVKVGMSVSIFWRMCGALLVRER